MLKPIKVLYVGFKEINVYYTYTICEPGPNQFKCQMSIAQNPTTSRWFYSKMTLLDSLFQSILSRPGLEYTLNLEWSQPNYSGELFLHNLMIKVKWYECLMVHILIIINLKEVPTLKALKDIRSWDEVILLYYNHLRKCLKLKKNTMSTIIQTYVLLNKILQKKRLIVFHARIFIFVTDYLFLVQSMYLFFSLSNI